MHNPAYPHLTIKKIITTVARIDRFGCDFDFVPCIPITLKMALTPSFLCLSREGFYSLLPVTCYLIPFIIAVTYYLSLPAIVIVIVDLQHLSARGGSTTLYIVHDTLSTCLFRANQIYLRILESNSLTLADPHVRPTFGRIDLNSPLFNQF